MNSSKLDALIKYFLEDETSLPVFQDFILENGYRLENLLSYPAKSFQDYYLNKNYGDENCYALKNNESIRIFGPDFDKTFKLCDMIVTSACMPMTQKKLKEICKKGIQFS